jgi:hypothetical protein
VLFSEYDENTDEFILSINFDVALEMMHNATAIGVMNSQGRHSLTKKFVNAYLMKDGTRFTDKPGWETMQFKDEVKDRDPRLAQTIRIPGYSRLTESGGKYSYSGKVQGPDMDITLTGYQTAKYLMPENNASNDKFDRSYNDLAVFRLGEIYLNYAEACNEKPDRNEADAFKYLNKVRNRVGLNNIEDAYPEIVGNKELLRWCIRQERMVELSMEALRHYDACRWMIAKEEYPTKNWTLHVCATNYEDSYQRVSSDFGQEVATPSFSDRDYLFPISVNQLSEMTNITQNYGF